MSSLCAGWWELESMYGWKGENKLEVFVRLQTTNTTADAFAIYHQGAKEYLKGNTDLSLWM